MGEADATTVPGRRVLCKIKLLPHRKGRKRWTHTDVLWKKQQNKQNKTTTTTKTSEKFKKIYAVL